LIKHHCTITLNDGLEIEVLSVADVIPLELLLQGKSSALLVVLELLVSAKLHLVVIVSKRELEEEALARVRYTGA
jgi:hypothetical protein